MKRFVEEKNGLLGLPRRSIGLQNEVTQKLFSTISFGILQDSV